MPRPRPPAPRPRLEELRPARPLSQAHSWGPREWQRGASEKRPRGAPVPCGGGGACLGPVLWPPRHLSPRSLRLEVT